MKFAIAKNIIQKALQNVSVAVGFKSTVQILSCVRVVAKDGVVSVVGTNLETEARDSFSCEIEREGTVAIPMSTLFEIIKRMPNDAMLSVEAVSSGTAGAIKVLLKTLTSSFEVVSLSGDDFPDVLGDNFELSMNLTSRSVLDLIRNTSFSISNNPDRYNLNGLLLHTSSDEGVNYLYAVSTDGHRLSVARSVCDADVSLVNKIVPRKSVVEMVKLLAANEQCIVRFSGNKVSILVGTISFTSKLLDSDFPDYKRVVPKNNDKIVDVNKSALLGALNRVAVIHELRGTKGVRLTISSENLEIAAVNPSGDTASETVACTLAGADKIEVSYNPQFIIDILNAVEGDVVQMVFMDSMTPVILKSPKDQNAYYVVMPIKIA